MALFTQAVLGSDIAMRFSKILNRIMLRFGGNFYFNISLSSVQSYEHSRIVNFSCMLHFLSGKTLENCTCGVFSKLATVLAALVGDRQSV